MFRTKRKYFRKRKLKGLHAHHVIPLHAGGSNDKDNIVFLTVEEHAEAHKKLFEDYGRWQDKIAWQMLSGMIGKEEAINIAQKNSDKSWMKTKEGRALMKEAQRKSKELGNRPDPWNKGKTKEQDERLMESSTRAKLHQQQGKIRCIGDSMRGKEFDKTHRDKLSLKAKTREKIHCEYCEKEVIKQMYVRWHGNNCKSRRG
jgi:hypothetical protein